MALDRALRPLEHRTLTAPFGARFWDVAGRDVVRSGLSVTAIEVESRREPPVFQNGSGVWIVSSLRLSKLRSAFSTDEEFERMGEFRFGDGTPQFWQYWSTPSLRLELTVTDTERRFVPYRFQSAAPQRGFARRACGDDGPIDAMPLYPAPTRAVPAGMAVVRAQIAYPQWTSPPAQELTVVPAAWACLDVLIDGDVAGRSYADEKGRVAVMFPWPKPIDHSLDSPPSAGSANALINQRWRVTLQAKWSGSLPADQIPNLCDVLAQPAVTLLESLPDVPLGGIELQYGRELVVRTSDTASPPTTNSVLLIRP